MTAYDVIYFNYSNFESRAHYQTFDGEDQLLDQYIRTSRSLPRDYELAV